MTREQIQAVVDRALNNAVANGYGDFLFEEKDVTLGVIAGDMTEHDEEIEEIVLRDLEDDAGKLIPFIEDWMRRQRS